jgi:HD-GYP domain-containing protein (c-di-GMP phosphodiesterase class II)/ABC-type amino acid transport substrate-binding protein
MKVFFKRIFPEGFLFWGRTRKSRTTSWIVLGLLIVALSILGYSVFGYRFKGILNDEERTWLKQHPLVTFAPDPSFAPIESFDEKGNYVGLVADYLDLIENNIGINIEIVHLNTWNDVLDQAKNRKIDGITAAQITPERSEYLLFTSPIVDIPNVIITQKDWTKPLTLKDMAGWSIAITRGYALEEYIKANYPFITISPQNSDLEALEAVSFNRAEATVVNLAIASNLINDHGITNLRIAGDSGKNNPLSIAVRSDDPILLRIMEKGLMSISDQQKRAIYKKWIGLENFGFTIQNQLLTFTFWVLAALAILVFASIFWNASLQSQVNVKTSALNRELAERKVAEERLNQQLANVSALRAVGVAINASMDLPLTLNILLDQVSSKLKVDACDVLLFNPYTRTLDYAADRGFRTPFIRGTSLTKGNSFAWQAVQTRRTIIIDNLESEPGQLDGSPFQEAESFVSYIGIPLISKGIMKGVLEVFQRSSSIHDQPWMDFLESMVSQAAIALDNGSLFQDLQRANLDLTLAYDATIEGWARALELRDGVTEGHSQRVTQMTIDLAVRLNVQDSDLVHIRRGALLHDIGKMGIPDDILLKAGPLTEAEWVIMRKHPFFAREMLKNISYLQPALEIPYCHHEKWDGSGYPQGLSGLRIPLAARIFSVIDVWDALSSERPYRGPWKVKDVYKYIWENSGTHFDPKVVNEFFLMMQR